MSQINISIQENFNETINQNIENLCGLIVENNQDIVQSNLIPNQLYTFKSVDDIKANGIIPFPSSYEQNNIFGTTFTTSSLDTISNSDTLKLSIKYDLPQIPPINIIYDPTQDTTFSDISGFPTGKYLTSIFDEVNDLSIIVATDGIYTSDPTQKLYTKQVSYSAAQFTSGLVNPVIKPTDTSGVFLISFSLSSPATISMFTYNVITNTISQIINSTEIGGPFTKITYSGSNYYTIISDVTSGNIISSTGIVTNVTYTFTGNPSGIALATKNYSFVQYDGDFYFATNNGIYKSTGVITPTTTLTYVTGGAAAIDSTGAYSKIHLTGVPNYPIGFMDYYSGTTFNLFNVNTRLYTFNITTKTVTPIGFNDGVSFQIKNVHWVQNTLSSGATEYGYFLSQGMDNDSPVTRMTYIVINNTGASVVGISSPLNISPSTFSLNYQNDKYGYYDNFVGYENIEKKILITNSTGTKVGFPTVKSSGAPFLGSIIVSNFTTLFQDLVNQINNDSRLSGNFKATYDGVTPSFSISGVGVGKQLTRISWNKISVTGVVTPIFTSTPIIPSYIQTYFNSDAANAGLYECIYAYFLKAPNTTLYFILRDGTQTWDSTLNIFRQLSVQTRPSMIGILDGKTLTIPDSITVQNLIQTSLDSLRTQYNMFASVIYSCNSMFINPNLQTLLSTRFDQLNNNNIMYVNDFDASVYSPMTKFLTNWDWTSTQLFPLPITFLPFYLGMYAINSVREDIGSRLAVGTNLSLTDGDNIYGDNVGLLYDVVNDTNIVLINNITELQKETLINQSICYADKSWTGVFLRDDRTEDLSTSVISNMNSIRVQDKISRIVYQTADGYINATIPDLLQPDGSLGQLGSQLLSSTFQSAINTGMNVGTLQTEIQPNPIVYVNPTQKPNQTKVLYINITAVLLGTLRTINITLGVKN